MKFQVRVGIGLIAVGVLAFLCVTFGFARQISFMDPGDNHPAAPVADSRGRTSTDHAAPPSGERTDTSEEDAAVPVLPIIGVVCLGTGIFVTVLGTSMNKANGLAAASRR